MPQREFVQADSDERGVLPNSHLSFPNQVRRSHSRCDRVLTRLHEWQHELNRPPEGHLHRSRQALYHTSCVVKLCANHRGDRVHLEYPSCKRMQALPSLAYARDAHSSI